jgi:Mycothiol maleylpyruvate isomerase N-terminal domain
MSTQPRVRQALMSEEDRRWRELHELVERLPEDQVATPGYFEEGWSAKDLLAHLASWLSEAGVVLEQMRFGTYRADEIDIDAMNERFYEAMKDVPLSTIRAQGRAARTRMLRAWGALGDGSPEADAWIRKAGPEHYAEHLPRLREWVDQLRGRAD